MKFVVYTKDRRDGEPMAEPYERDEVNTLEEAKAWAAKTIVNFNRTLRKHERPRRVVRVEVDASTAGAIKFHAWHKTNLVTQMKRGVMFDAYRCERCGITGTKIGFEGEPMRDKRYKAEVYARCDTSMKKRKVKYANG